MNSYETIKNVGSIRSFSNRLFYCLKDGSLFMDDKLLINEVECQSYWLKENYLYYHDLNGLHCFLNLETNKVSKQEKGVAWFSIHNGTAICSFELARINKQWSWKTGVLDIQNQKIVKLIDKLTNTSLAYYIDETFVITYKSSFSLGGYSLLKDEYEWNVDLTEIGRFTDHRGETHQGQIEHVLGIWQDTLWVWLKGYQCVGIHTATGQITHHWFPFQDLFKPGHFFVNFPHFDAHTGQIHFFERSYFIQIDLATQHSQILWQDKAYEINASTVDQDYIYFIGAQPASVYSTVVGVFDRQANAVVWTDTIELPPFVTLSQAPVVGADKLYVLDSAGTLRIYQREE